MGRIALEEREVSSDRRVSCVPWSFSSFCEHEQRRQEREEQKHQPQHQTSRLESSSSSEAIFVQHTNLFLSESSFLTDSKPPLSPPARHTARPRHCYEKKRQRDFGDTAVARTTLDPSASLGIQGHSTTIARRETFLQSCLSYCGVSPVVCMWCRRRLVL